MDSHSVADAVNLQDSKNISILNHGNTCLRPATRWVVNFKSGYFEDYFRFDYSGYSGWSSLARRFQLKTYPDREFKCIRNSQIKDYKKLSWPRPFVVFFSQNPSDTAMSISKYTQSEVLESIVKFSESMEYDVLLKLHPNYLKRIRENSLRIRDHEIESKIIHYVNENRAFLVDKSVHSLAAPARAVFTTNSTTGFKSLLHEKPVFTFGESDYTSASYSADIHKYRHWEEVIRKHEKSSIIKNFVVTYLNEYSFRYSDPDLKSKLYYFFKKHICGYKKYVYCRSQKSQNKKAILKNVIV